MGKKNFFKRLWRDDRGQTTTEYILILAIVVMVALQVKKGLKDGIGTLLGKVTQNLNEAVEP